MLVPLCCGAKELTKVAYGTTCRIQAVAIVEEPKKEWWLVLGLASPQNAHNFKSYLRARVPLDLERMTPLTPWLALGLGRRTHDPGATEGADRGGAFAAPQPRRGV